MEVFIIAALSEASRNSEGGWWGEAFESRLLEWVLADDLIQLAVAIVGAVDGLKRGLTPMGMATGRRRAFCHGVCN